MQILHSECTCRQQFRRQQKSDARDENHIYFYVLNLFLEIMDKRKSKILEDLTEKKPITGESWTGIVSNNTEYSKLKQGLTED